MNWDPHQDKVVPTPAGDSSPPREFACTGFCWQLQLLSPESLGAALLAEVCFEMKLFDVATFCSPAASRRLGIISL